MAGITVSIGGNDYPSYSTVAQADLYLAADALRAEPWAALVAEGAKERMLVSATRLLQRQSWKDGLVPTTEDPVPAVVAAATALLAADIAAKPGVGDNGSTASNIKLVGGSGVPTVEFFRPVAGTPLPQAAFDLLRDLLGPSDDLDDPALNGTAYGSSSCQVSRFDVTDYRILGDGLGPVEGP